MMKSTDQQKLLDAGFTLARQGLGNKLLILRATDENWVNFTVPMPNEDTLNPDELEMYVNEEETKFLMHPKTIMV